MRLSEAESQLQLQKWTTIIQEYMSSGMKLKDWLYENNISKDQYYYWHRKLKEEAIRCNMQTFVDITEVSQPPAVAESKNLPVAHENNNEPAAVIRFQNYSIEINNTASVEIIRNLVKAMAYVK
jgi:hypothetical protein